MVTINIESTINDVYISISVQDISFLCGQLNVLDLDFQNAGNLTIRSKFQISNKLQALFFLVVLIEAVKSKNYLSRAFRECTEIRALKELPWMDHDGVHKLKQFK